MHYKNLSLSNLNPIEIEQITIVKYKEQFQDNSLPEASSVSIDSAAQIDPWPTDFYSINSSNIKDAIDHVP